MTTKRSDQVYQHYLVASEKFDYFVLGVSIALVGYLAADLEPTALGLTSSGLQAFAAGAFLISSFSGFKRVESHVVLLKTMYSRLYSEESAGALAQVASSGRQAVNTSTGRSLTPNEALQQYYFHSVGAEVTSEWLETAVKRSGRWYMVRNLFLLGGLALLLASKLLPIYLG